MRIGAAALAAALAVSGWGAASACDLINNYRFKVSGGTFAVSVNGVHLRQETEADDYSGGGPLDQWLVAGENSFKLALDAGTAEIRLFDTCPFEFDGRTLVRTEIGAGETAELIFFVETPPPAAYDGAGPLTEDGLVEALAALKASIDAKDYDAFYAFHEPFIAVEIAKGAPEDMITGMLTRTLEEGAASYEDDLVFEPVLGGKVWQVMTAGREAPVKISLDEGRFTFTSGAYWSKVDGKWRIIGR